MRNLSAFFILFLFFSCDKSVKDVIQPDVLPVLRISTENKVEVTSKEVYQKAFMEIEGENPFKGNIEIRGRGNTTWTYPKKPFKIKLDEKAGLLGLPKAKRWVLLANYLDPSLMLNAVSMKLGQLLNMEYTNHIIPVDLWLNNEFLGNYTLTEQIEVGENRVNIGNDGVLLSLDTIIESDDIYFESQNYHLPVQVKHPENYDEIGLDEIKEDFNELENSVFNESFPLTDYLNYLDAESVAKYLIVYTLTCNEEINHPKSTYMYKRAGSKFKLGPIWDFDWAFSYEQSQVHYVNPNRSLFWEWDAKGTIFFQRIASDPRIKSLMKSHWQSFRENDFNELLDFIDLYASQIEDSRKADYKKWGRGESSIDLEKEALKNWLILRAKYMDELMISF